MLPDPQVPADLVIFTEEIKLYFLCSFINVTLGITFI